MASGVGDGGASPRGRLRRAWDHRSVKVAAIVTAVVVVAVTAGAGWVAWRYRQVARLDVDTPDPAPEDDTEGVQVPFPTPAPDLNSIQRQQDFRLLTPDSLQSFVLPTTPGATADGRQVLYLDAAGAPPVLQASGRNGQVRAAAFRLSAAGFVVPVVGRAPARLDRTRIRYGEGQAAAAELVAARVAPRSRLGADPGMQGVDVVLDIGRDWQRVLDPDEVFAPTARPPAEEPAPAPAEAASPTTAAPPPITC